MLSELQRQCEGEDVEVITDVDDGQMVIGQKRQKMLEQASGDYVVFIDDDDRISRKYVSKIMKALQSDPDVVTYKLHYISDEDEERIIPVDFSLRFSNDSNNFIPFERLPNHLCPVKRELALKAGFKPLRYAEDAVFARKLKPFLKTEVHINDVLYTYLDFEK